MFWYSTPISTFNTLSKWHDPRISLKDWEVFSNFPGRIMNIWTLIASFGLSHNIWPLTKLILRPNSKFLNRPPHEQCHLLRNLWGWQAFHSCFISFSSMSLQAPCPPPSPRLHHPSYSKKSQEEIYDQYLRDGLQNYYLQQQKLQKTTKKLKHQTSDENAAAAEKLRKQKMSEKTNSSSNSSKVNRDQKSAATLMAAAASAGVHGLLYLLDMNLYDLVTSNVVVCTFWLVNQRLLKISGDHTTMPEMTTDDPNFRIIQSIYLCLKFLYEIWISLPLNFLSEIWISF